MPAKITIERMMHGQYCGAKAMPAASYAYAEADSPPGSRARRQGGVNLAPGARRPAAPCTKEDGTASAGSMRIQEARTTPSNKLKPRRPPSPSSPSLTMPR